MIHYFEDRERPTEFLCGAVGGDGVWANEVLAGIARPSLDACRPCVSKIPELLRSPEPSVVDLLAALSECRVEQGQEPADAEVG